MSAAAVESPLGLEQLRQRPAGQIVESLQAQPAFGILPAVAGFLTAQKVNTLSLGPSMYNCTCEC